MPTLVSVITPIYGVEDYIEEYATSLFRQTYQNIEYIFVNDCTKDSSMTVLENVISHFPQVKEKVKIINHEKNMGSAGARLTGLNAATGDYTIQFDSDDYIETNIIEVLVNKAISDNADIVICDYDLVGHGLPRHIKVNPPFNNIELLKKLFTGEVHGSLCNKLIRRTLYTDNDIKFTIGLNMCEDLSVMHRLVYYAKNISYVPGAFYHYRQNVAGSFSSEKMPIKHQLNRIQLLEQVNEFITTKANNNQELKRYYTFMVIGNKGEMLLYGDLSKMEVFANDYMKFSIRNILSHPALHRNFKIITLLEELHLRPMVHLMRLMPKIKMHVKSILN